MLFTLNFLPLWLTDSWQSSLFGGNSNLDFSPTILQSFLYTNKDTLSLSRVLQLLIFFQQLNQSTFVLLIYTSYNTFVVLILLTDTDRYFLGYYFCLYLLSVTLNVKLCWHGLLLIWKCYWYFCMLYYATILDCGEEFFLRWYHFLL